MSSSKFNPGQIKKPSVEASAWCYTANKNYTDFTLSEKIKMYKDEFLTSSVFKVFVEGKETAWKLECYPNGLETYDGFISVFLCPANDAAMNLPFKYDIGIANRMAEDLQYEEYNRCEDRNGLGYNEFVAHSDLDEDDEIAPQDCLTLLCIMKFGGSEVKTSGTSRPTTFPLDIEMDKEEDTCCSAILELFHTGDMADVEVKCKGRIFHCHKVILGSKSPIFKAAFTHNMKEKSTGSIAINNIDQDTVADVLMFIYGGQIERLEEKADKLLSAADQYDLKQLKKRCEECLVTRLNIRNCVDYLILAHLHSAVLLKPSVMGFLVENFGEVVGHVDNWKEKLATFPDLFAEVFNYFAPQPRKDDK